MPLALWQRKEIWVPTWTGWITFLLLLGGGGAFVVSHAESFLAFSAPVPADTLVVEGWISGAAIPAAVKEFQNGHYRYVVAVGGWTAQAVTPTLGHTYAQYIASRLLQAGCPSNCLLIALPSPNDTDRTFEQARSAWRLLRDRQITPLGLNVFTSGPHARRSRLVYRKTFGPGLPIGVISYQPEDSLQGVWWKDSLRGKQVIEETLGWLRESLNHRSPEP